MSAKSIVMSLFGKSSKNSAKSIVQDALEQAGVDVETSNEEASSENDKKQVLEFHFTLDPEMVKTLGAAMPKGAKSDDRPDTLLPGDEESSQSEDIQHNAGGDSADGETDGQESHRDITADREFDQDDEPLSLEEAKAQDEAIAMDNRHSNTPIENCRAEDPMFCPYHGAQRMQQMIESNIKQRLGANPNVVVEVIKNGSDFTARVTYPSNTSANDQQNIEQAIQSFLGIKGIKNNTSPLQSSQNQITTNKSTEGQFSTQSLKERMPQGSTPSDYDTAKAKQDLEIINEWMDDLIEDFGDATSDIDPFDLESLMNQQMELEDLANQMASGNAQATSQFKTAKQNFEEQYHTVRGIADLPQVKTTQDAVQMRDDIASERHKAGDWWNAKEEIVDLRKQLGLMQGNRALPMKTVMAKFPTLFAGWDKYKTKYENLYLSSIKKILGDGRNDVGANGKFSDAEQKGDLRQMKGALHTLKYATEEYADLMPAFMKAMQAHKDDLLNYAKQQGITVAPYTPKQSSQTAASQTGVASVTSTSTATGNTAAPTVASIQKALSGVPAGIVMNVLQNQNGQHFIECHSGNANYVQSLIPSLQKQFPNSKFSFVPAAQTNSGADIIQID